MPFEATSFSFNVFTSVDKVEFVIFTSLLVKPWWRAHPNCCYQYFHSNFTTVLPVRNNCWNTHWELILGGVNFLKISETIASMNYKSYCHRGCIYLASLSGGEPGISSNSPYSFNDFYGDVLFSFPSANLLIYMYLEHFQEMRPFYEYEMSRLSASIISCDHTFKVSKNIVAFRSSGNKFVSQFQNLFIVLNDQKEVIEWRFAKTC